MTKKKGLCIVAVAVLALTLALVLLRAQSKEPRAIFADLRLEDIASIEETYGGFPPYTLPREEQEKLVGLMQKIKVSKTEKSWMDYDGIKARMFVLHMTDGKKIEVGGFHPLVVVDQMNYETLDFGLCQEISRLYFSHVDAIRAESEPVL